MRKFCKTRKEMQLTLESSSPGHSCTSVGRNWDIEGAQTTIEKSAMHLQNKLRKCILYDAEIFKRIVEARWREHALQRQ